jgi:hypothetical protein
MKLQLRRTFAANIWERLKDLPELVEIFVPGGLLILVSVVALLVVVYLLGGGSVLWSMNEVTL